MASRRTMKEALTPEAQAFLSEAKPARADESKQVFVQASNEGTITATFRLRLCIASAIRRASMERRLQRKAPYTQQDIVEDASQKWLQDQGIAL